MPGKLKKKRCFSVLQDPIQFANRGNRNVEDAILVFLQNVYKHLDTPKNYCRILFVDFSSAFNTIQPHLWIYKLHKLDLNLHVTAWIVNFLTARPQYVKLKDRHCFFKYSYYQHWCSPRGCAVTFIIYNIHKRLYNCQQRYYRYSYIEVRR